MSILNNLSPGVNIREFDLGNFLTAGGMSVGGHVMDAEWGYANEIINVSSTGQFERVFGRSTNKNYVSWLSCMNYLSYSGNLSVVRVIDSNAMNADDTGNGILIKNRKDLSYATQSDTGSMFAAKYAGELGNSLRVIVVDAASWNSLPLQYQKAFDLPPSTSTTGKEQGTRNDEIHVLVIDERGLFRNRPNEILESYAFLTKGRNGTDEDNQNSFYQAVINRASAFISVLDMPDLSLLASDKRVESVDIVDSGTGYSTSATAEIVGDGTGAKVSLVFGTGADIGKIIDVKVISAGQGYTTATLVVTDATGIDFDATVNLVAVQSDPWGTSILKPDGSVSKYAEMITPFDFSLTGGKSSINIGADELIAGWSLFADSESTDTSWLFLGDAGGEDSHIDVCQYVIDNIVTVRMDCLAYISPPLSCFPRHADNSEIVARILEWREKLARAESFFVLNNMWGLVNDPYSKRDRWIPFTATHAGLRAQTSDRFDAFISDAGYNRGKVKGVKEFIWNPSKRDRDLLHTQSVNNFVNDRADGMTLLGDQTGQIRPGFFRNVGVRCLFILMRKVIGNAAKYMLFERNNSYTRSSFTRMVEPWLTVIQGRGGINRFQVICDSSNNPQEEIDKGNFYASIIVNPTVSIQQIELNMVAAKGSANFTEISRNL